MHQSKDKVYFGFWLYMMTDLLMFSVLFAVFAVLRDSTFGGVTIKEIFDLPFVFVETIILLTSSLTVGLALLFAKSNEKTKALIYLLITAILGLVFVGMELYEFSHLLSEGHSYKDSAFLSSFFTLLSFHGLHIIAGVVWIAILIAHIYRKGLADINIRKLGMLGIFWHFLDVVWIFIFTVVYLLGGIL